MSEESRAFRLQLAAWLEAEGYICTPSVRRAFEMIPRETFLEQSERSMSLEEVYVDTSYGTKRDLDGNYLSASSRPSLQASLIESLNLGNGHNVLDIGTGSGYTAALVGYIVGRNGRVTSLEIDKDLALAANEKFNSLGLHQVTSYCYDGAGGLQDNSPYDSIIITCQQVEVLPPWLDQLKEGGTLVVPLTIGAYTHGSPIIVFKKHKNTLIGWRTIPGSFLPARGRLGHPPICDEFVVPIVDQSKENLGMLRLPQHSEQAPLALKFEEVFSPHRSIRFYAPLSNAELSGIFLFFHLHFRRLVMLYSMNKRLGFVGLGVSDSFSHNQPTTFLTRNGFVKYGKANGTSIVEDSYANWRERGRPTIRDFLFDVLPKNTSNKSNYDWLVQKRFYDLGVRIREHGE